MKNRKLFLATLASVLGPMSFGFVLGYSSPAIPELMKISNPRLRLDDEEASWFGVRHPSWRRNVSVLSRNPFLLQLQCLVCFVC